jgi:segregation and condensation protein B
LAASGAEARPEPGSPAETPFPEPGSGLAGESEPEGRADRPAETLFPEPESGLAGESEPEGGAYRPAETAFSAAGSGLGGEHEADGQPEAESQPEARRPADPDGWPEDGDGAWGDGEEGAEGEEEREGRPDRIPLDARQELATSAGVSLEFREAPPEERTGLDPAEIDSPAPVRPPLKTILEGLIFVADEPLSVERLLEAFEDGITKFELEGALDELAAEWARLGRAFGPKKVAGGWQFRTSPSIAPFAIRLKGRAPAKLSKAAMETLAVIAYRQPALRAEVEKIRGVDAGGVIKTLLEKGLVRISGRKDTLPGRPMLYSTTAKFLETFELADIKSLPTIEDIERLCPPKRRLF